jgi:D-3-phosphoglycerate dehydrogenase
VQQFRERGSVFATRPQHERVQARPKDVLVADVDAATAAGIVVTNVPDVFIEEVADHAMTLPLDTARMTSAMARVAAEGRWWTSRRPSR